MTETPQPDPGQARDRLAAVRTEVAKAVVGQDAAVSGLLVALLCGGHVLMEGVPGVAKTLLVRTLAAALSVDARRVQFTPDLMPGDITGSMVIDSTRGELSFREGPVFTNLLLADEINRTPPKTQSALLEAMEEGQVSVDGVSRPLPRPFLVAATQNPVEYEGTYPLPEAQIDRFLVRVAIGYPSHKDEVAMLRTHNVDSPKARSVLSSQDLLLVQGIAKRVHVEDDIYEYAVGLTTFTRSHPRVLLGASPRATLGLIQAAKSAAVIGGRPFVTPDDVRGVASAVLGHRLVLVPEADNDQKARDAVIDDAIQRVGYRRAVRPV